MRIVVKDRRFGASVRPRYAFDVQVDYPSIPDNLPLTNNVMKQYQATKNNIGYTTFRGLNIDDIKTILSAVKRQDAHVNVNRMGHCAYYKLHIVNRISGKYTG